MSIWNDENIDTQYKKYNSVFYENKHVSVITVKTCTFCEINL